MNKKQIVAVIGDGALPPNSEKERFAEGLGEALVTAGYRIICGGLGGVMEAAARGAHRSPWYRDGDVIGVLPGCSPDAANEFIDRCSDCDRRGVWNIVGTLVRMDYAATDPCLSCTTSRGNIEYICGLERSCGR